MTAPDETTQIQPSKVKSVRLSTEGLVLRKRRTSVNAVRCFFAEGEIGGTPCMRSHISVHRATTKYFSNSFIFKNKIEKEGLPRDSPARLGAGGREFKSRRPDHCMFCFSYHLEMIAFCYYPCEFLADRRSVFASHSISITSLHCEKARTQKGNEENQQVAIKRDERTSLIYSPFVRTSSRFAAITVTFS